MLQVPTSRARGGERVVGPSCLPAGLPKTIVPSQVQEFLGRQMTGEDAMGHEEATLHVATKVARSFNYALEVNLRHLFTIMTASAECVSHTYML